MPTPSTTARPTGQPSTTEPGQPADHASWRELFAGGGALFAAGLLATLVTYRRRQHRFRRSGRTIPAAPDRSRPAERALIAATPDRASGVDLLDGALHGLAAAIAAHPDWALPNIVAARLDDQQLELHLLAPHRNEPPAPWTSDDTGLRWSTTLHDTLPKMSGTHGEREDPYPALVTVGSETDGSIWLLDLEAVGVLTVTGDHERCLDFGRFLAAELAVNSWSEHLAVTTVGLGSDIVQLNPARLRATEQLNDAIAAATREFDRAVAAQQDDGVDVLSGRLRDVDRERGRTHLLLAAPTRTADSSSSENAGVPDAPLRAFPARSSDGRSAVAIVLLDPETSVGSGGFQAMITADGRLTIPQLGLDITAQRMPVDQVAPLAQLLAHAASLSDEPMPPSTGEADYEQLCDAGGAVRTELTLPRDSSEQSSLESEAATGDVSTAEIDDGGDGAVVASGSVLLNLDDDIYLDRSASTAADLQALSPRIPREIQAKVRDADPTLDDDIAAWFDPDCSLARLSLLGPVELRARGEYTTDVARRVAYYTELAAYLATRDHGATADQVAAAFNVATSTAYSRLAVLKAWLGINPRTGERHLPDATKSPSGRARGIGLYQLEGVLVDADLFKRLRLRGQGHGAGGISDLTTALTLVSGPPFDQLRSGGYEWLTDGNRLDHIYVDAIVDVAHILATHGLGSSDLATARAAAEIALLAAPYEEKPRLDLVAIRHAEGRTEDANAYLRTEICNRSDDGGAPLDLPERTEEILRRRAWLTRAG